MTRTAARVTAAGFPPPGIRRGCTLVCRDGVACGYRSAQTPTRRPRLPPPATLFKYNICTLFVQYLYNICTLFEYTDHVRVHSPVSAAAGFPPAAVETINGPASVAPQTRSRTSQKQTETLASCRRPVGPPVPCANTFQGGGARPCVWGWGREEGARVARRGGCATLSCRPMRRVVVGACAGQVERPSCPQARAPHDRWRDPGQEAPDARQSPARDWLTART